MDGYVENKINLISTLKLLNGAYSYRKTTDTIRVKRKKNIMKNTSLMWQFMLRNLKEKTF